VNGKIVRIVVWGSVAIAAIVVLYIRYPTWKVNGAIKEANALIDDADAKRKELGSESEQLLLTGRLAKTYFVKRDEHAAGHEDEFVNADGSKDLVLDRAKLKGPVEKASGILAQLAEDYHAAAAKFDEGKRASKSEAITKYLDLMSQACEKRAEAEDDRVKAVALLLDKSIRSEDELYKKRNELVQKARKSEGEFDRLEFEAQKFHDENKGKFK